MRGGKPLTQTKENEKKYKGDFLILENFFPFGKTINFWAEIGKSEFNLYLLDTSVSPLKKYFLKNLLISTSDEVQLKQFLGHKKLLNHEVFMILAAIYILVNFLLFYLGKSKNLAKENR